MAKNKLARFRENLTFPYLHQPTFDSVWRAPYPLQGQWAAQQFSNQNPITLELGCGRGEYTVALAQAAPEQNYIGMDIKGARLWVGARAVKEQGLTNVAFVRARIETLTSFFAPNAIAHLWLTFPDPQLKERRAKKRLTGERFLELYSRILAPSGVIHLKTDSRELYDFTLNEVATIGGRVLYAADNIDNILEQFPLLRISTYYERYFRERGKTICYLEFGLPEHWKAIGESEVWQSPCEFWLGETHKDGLEEE